MTVNGLVASSFLDFLSFFAMILFPPFFCLPVWANAAYYARCGPRFPAKKYLCYVVGNSRDAQNRPDIEAVPRAVCVDLINLTMNYSTLKGERLNNAMNVATNVGGSSNIRALPAETQS
jgi:hypothetical protein